MYIEFSLPVIINTFSIYISDVDFAKIHNDFIHPKNPIKIQLSRTMAVEYHIALSCQAHGHDSGLSRGLCRKQTAT